ncbi:Slp family lipoprotein, partial [Geobacter sp.]|uniref:Slp family lipoprotein n=1 Tax=Geobacter sp. TaxID=46610 RepID=UPI00260F0EC6
MRRMVVAAVMALLLGGVGEARGFSTEALRLVDESITFIELSAHPENYRGKYVLLGGTIVGEETGAGGTRLEVAELPLDSARKPDDSFSAGGHFVAISRDVLSAARYRPGVLVTVIGRVTGTAPVVAGGEEYPAPAVAIREMRIWVEYGPDRGYGEDEGAEVYDYR